MKKNHHFVALLVVCMLLVYCGQQDSSSSLQELPFHEEEAYSSALANKERAEYEWRRIINPYTQTLPDDIRSKELQFVQSIPAKSFRNDVWQSRGPLNVGGRTRAIQIDVSDSNRMLVGAVSGGLWVSNDGGLHFEKVTQTEQLHSVTCLAQDIRPGHQQTWYYGTGEYRGNSADLIGNGIYKSEDGGISWEHVVSTSPEQSNQVISDGDFNYVWDVVVNPTNGDVLAATYGGIFISQDEGITWQNMLQADAFLNDWGYINYGNLVSLDVTSSGVFYATLSSDCTHKGIWRSEDGLQWTEITPMGFPGVFRRIEIGIAPSDENQVYFIAESTTNPFIDRHELWHYTYVSGDGTSGLWEDRSAYLPDGSCTGFYDFDFGYYQSQNSYDMCVVVHPEDPEVVFLGGTNLYRSTDGFTSNTYDWIGGYQCDTTNPSNYVWPNHHPDQHDIVFLPNNAQVMISAHDGGLSRTNDCLASSVIWESVNNQYNTGQFYTVAIEQGNTDSEMIIGGLQDNGTWLTNTFNTNTSWKSVFYGDGAYCAISEGRTHYYVSWQGGKTFKFEINDEGDVVALTRIDPVGGDDFLFINPFILDPNDNNTMYLAGGRYIWKNDSLDQIPLLNDEYNPIATGWTKIEESDVAQIFFPGSLLPRISTLDVSPANSDVIYYGTWSGKIYKLSGLTTGNYVQESITPSSAPSGGYVSCVDAHPTDTNVVVATFSNYGVVSVFYSEDGGHTWESIGGNIEENPDGSGNGPSVNWIHLYSTGEQTTCYIGTSAGLFSTDEFSGDSTVWFREGLNEIGNVPVTMITSRTHDQHIVVATHGNGIYSNKHFSTNIHQVDNEENHISMGVLYPNPFSSKVRIPVFAHHNMNIEIAIFDITGNLVKTLAKEYVEKGKSIYEWNGFNDDHVSVSDGLYRVVIETDQGTWTHKPIIKLSQY